MVGVDGHRFELSGAGSSREFSFGGWSVGCSWYIREPDFPASLDGWGQLDPVAELIVLRGSVPSGAVGVATVQGDDRSAVILLADEETNRPGWIGFSLAQGPPLHLEWTEPGGEIKQLSLRTGGTDLGREDCRGHPQSALIRIWRKLTGRSRD